MEEEQFAGIIRQACVLTTDLQTNIAACFSSKVDYSFQMARRVLVRLWRY